MKWITRERIKVDRVACPWLIRNFIDPEAEFVFLSRDTDWSKIDKEILFDVPKCELGHNGDIVRAADSHPRKPHAAGAGLRWIANGFGKLGLNDHEILEREFAVYDALYLECKERTSDTRKPAHPPSLFEIASIMR
jgi:hypothetical protein